MHNGNSIDRDVSEFIGDLVDREYVNHWSMKPPHGMLPQLASLTTLKAEMIGRKSLMQKILTGRATCHVRQLYIDSKTYKKGSVLQRAKVQGWITDTVHIKHECKKADIMTWYKGV
jgi:hypothetical protein